VTATVRATRAPGPDGAPRGRSPARAPVGQHRANGANVRFPRVLRTGSNLAAQVHRHADPAAMSPDARMAELGGILATGYRRLVLSLAEKRDPEAQCDRTP